MPPNNAAPSTPPPSADDRARAERLIAAVINDRERLAVETATEHITAIREPLEAEIARLRELSAAAVLGKATAERAVARIMDQREALSRKVTLLESEIARLTRERDEALEVIKTLLGAMTVQWDTNCTVWLISDVYRQNARAFLNAARKERG